jgi:hypothetical protein
MWVYSSEDDMITVYQKYIVFDFNPAQANLLDNEMATEMQDNLYR